ncbi:DsrE family protein [Mangrovibacterium marinum]|uniref:DsrE/DsrF/DsrH-like protein n=1 Tax=Mangrovibacterium marinum TaxID=1639118 RepID=A0A2T5BX99_9BACT|nr:DsrE family protein [Mangrovibacterium marinum]PTN04787.1 DsrE/DsrF/DsrH-like protein [Mangrovibacterium marinum]
MYSLKNTLIQITQKGMGSGNEELALVLVKNYFKLLTEEQELPRVIAFYNTGVELIVKGSPVLAELKILEEKGVRLVACKTCLKHLSLLEKMKVGIAGTMMDILELQKVACKVISL